MGKAVRVRQVRDAWPSFSPRYFGGAEFWLREIRRTVRGDFASAGDGYDCARPLAGQKEDCGGYEFGGVDERLEDAGECKAGGADAGEAFFGAVAIAARGDKSGRDQSSAPAASGFGR